MAQEAWREGGDLVGEVAESRRTLLHVEDVGVDVHVFDPVGVSFEQPLELRLRHVVLPQVVVSHCHLCGEVVAFRKVGLERLVEGQALRIVVQIQEHGSFEEGADPMVVHTGEDRLQDAAVSAQSLRHTGTVSR